MRALTCTLYQNNGGVSSSLSLDLSTKMAGLGTGIIAI